MSHLREFAYTMFASLVQYLQQFMDSYGDKHVVVTTLCRVAREFGYPVQTLLSWGAAVAADWALKNIANVDKESDLGPLVVKLQQEIMALKEQNNATQQQVITVKEQMKTDHAVLQGKINGLEHACAQILQAVSYGGGERSASPLRKRRLGVSSPTPTPVSETPATALPMPDVPSTSSAAALLAVSIQTPAVQPPGAVPQLRPPSPVFHILNTTRLYDLYKTWYVGKFTTEDHAGRWTTPIRQDRVRVKAAVNFTNAIMSDNVSRTLRAAPPAHSDPQYAIWSSAYVSACSALVKEVTTAIKKHDTKDFKCAPTVTALASRVKSNPAANGKADAAGKAKR